MRLVRPLVVLAMVLMSAQAVCASDGWISFDGRAEAPATVSVVESDMSRLVLGIDVPGVLASDVATSGGTFTRLTLDGAGRTVVVGEGLLPVVREFVEIPYGADPVLTVTWSDYRTSTLAAMGVRRALLPVQRSRREDPRGARGRAVRTVERLLRERQLRARAAGSPERRADDARAQVRTAGSEPRTLQPGARERSSTATRIEVDDRVPRRGPVAKRRRVLDRYSNGRFAAVAADMFINHAAFVSRYDIPLPIGYLIVTLRQLRRTRSSRWPTGRLQKGYHTTVVSDVGHPGRQHQGEHQGLHRGRLRQLGRPADVRAARRRHAAHQPLGRHADEQPVDRPLLRDDGRESSDWQPDIWIGRFSCTIGRAGDQPRQQDGRLRDAAT